QGKELQDRVRASVIAMETIERAQLRARDQLAQHSASVTRTVISGGSALAIGCVVVALFLIGGDFAGSRRAEAALREANERLEARVLERTRALGQSEARLGGIVGSATDAIISVTGNPVPGTAANNFSVIPGGFQQNGVNYPHLSAHLKNGLPQGADIGYKDGHAEWRKFKTSASLYMTPRTSGGTVFWW
ncbi:MAG: hypothetical protein RL616_2245, partial [Verrucomicrobiota bacterium]